MSEWSFVEKPMPGMGFSHRSTVDSKGVATCAEHDCPLCVAGHLPGSKVQWRVFRAGGRASPAVKLDP